MDDACLVACRVWADTVVHFLGSLMENILLLVSVMDSPTEEPNQRGTDRLSPAISVDIRMKCFPMRVVRG